MGGVCSSLVAIFSWQQVTNLAAVMAHWYFTQERETPIAHSVVLSHLCLFLVGSPSVYLHSLSLPCSPSPLLFSLTSFFLTAVSTCHCHPRK